MESKLNISAHSRGYSRDKDHYRGMVNYHHSKMPSVDVESLDQNETRYRQDHNRVSSTALIKGARDESNSDAKHYKIRETEPGLTNKKGTGGEAGAPHENEK